MTLPLVSVVIPAWNAANWIAESLQSVCQQTYPLDRLEVIVVDDASIDDTSGVASRILDASRLRHTLLNTGAQSGPSAARNLGWRHAGGSWIQFLDADDVLDPEKVLVQGSAAASAGAEVAAFFSPWGHLVHRDRSWISGAAVFDPVVGDDPLKEVLHPANFIHTGSQLVQRSWLEAVGGFNESCRLVEDVDLQLRLLMHDGVMKRVTSRRPLFWYRQRSDSASRRSPHEFMRACVRNVKTVEAYWRTHDALTPDRVAALVELYFGPVRFFAEHDRGAFEDVLRTIEALAPHSLPKGPRSLRLLSRLIGYRQAERIAVTYRQMMGA